MNLAIDARKVKAPDGTSRACIGFMIDGGISGYQIVLDEEGLRILIAQAQKMAAELRRDRSGIVIPDGSINGSIFKQ